MADHAFVSLRIFAERTLAYRRKDVDVSPKGRWHIAERTLAYRRKGITISPKKRRLRDFMMILVRFWPVFITGKC